MCRKLECINIQMEGNHTQHDSWMQQRKHSKSKQITDVYQTVSVQEGDQHALLQTRVPQTFINDQPADFILKKRRTN